MTAPMPAGEKAGAAGAHGGKVLVITGMHRSGTSLVASLLERGGLHLGDKLLEADKGNPRGYFEDVDLYEFHREALASRQQHLSVDEGFVFEPTEAERRRAKAIVAGRSHRSSWGWKDPRTALFLDFWHEQLPDARFLFLFRHPIDVLLSLVRRGDVNCLGLTEGLDAWARYNKRILEFFDRHRERSLLCHIRGVMENEESFASLLHDHLGFHLETSHLEAVYHPKELRHVELSGEMARAFASIHPSVARLCERLNESAHLGFGEESAPSTTGGRFFKWIEELDSEASPGLRRGLTSALVALLEPESLDNLYRTFITYQMERDRGLAWLEGRLEGLEKLLSVSAREYEKLRAWTGELQRGRDWLLEQRTHFEEDRKRRIEQYEELHAWVAELELGRDWLQQQRKNLEAALTTSVAEARASRDEAEELRNRIEKLESEKEGREGDLRKLVREKDEAERRASALENELERLLAERASIENRPAGRAQAVLRRIRSRIAGEPIPGPKP